MSVAFSSDGKYLASGSDDETVKLWRVETGECIFSTLGYEDSREGHFHRINSVAFSGKYIASGSADRTVKIWKVRDTAKEKMRLLLGVLNRRKETRKRDSDGNVANEGARELYKNMDALQNIKEFL